VTPGPLPVSVTAAAGLLTCLITFTFILLWPVTVAPWVSWFVLTLGLVFFVLLLMNRSGSWTTASDPAATLAIATPALAKTSVVERVLADLPEGLLIVDADGRVLFGNRAAERFFDLELEATPLEWARRHGVHVGESDRPCPDEEFPLALALAGEDVDNRELFVRSRLRPDGAWLSVTARAVRDAPGRPPTAAAMIFRDVTRSHRVAQALKEDRNHLQHEHRRQSALAEIEMAIAGARELWPVLDQVAERAQLLLPATNAFIVLNPEELPDTPPRLDRLGTRLDRDDPATRWIFENGRPLAVPDLADDPFQISRSEPGPAAAYAGVPLLADDRTLGVLFALSSSPHAYTQEELDFMSSLARRAAAAITQIMLHDQVLESEHRLRGLADTVPAMIWMAGADKLSTYFNQTWSDFTGRPLDADVGCAWTDVGIHPDDVDRSLEKYSRMFDAREPFRLEYRLRRADGVYRWVLDTGTPQFAADGVFLGYIGSCIDITDRREAEQALELRREELESLVEERTAELTATHERLRVADRLASLGTFAAGIGHDMNNVLFPVRCRLDALDWERVPSEHEELFDTVKHSVEYLQQLTDGLRLVSLDPDDGEPGGVTDVAEWRSQIEPLLAKAVAGVEVVFDVPELPPLAVAPHRMTQAVLNLVINASEAKPRDGRVIVRVFADGRDDVVLQVIDRGSGMTPEIRRQAPDPFFTTKKRSLSTGLGLSLVHAAVSASRGTVDIESTPGEGTTVTLRLPVADEVDEDTPAASAVISVESARTAAWLAQLLRADGFETRIAADGEPGDAAVWVTAPTPETRLTAARFLAADRRRRVIVFGEPDVEWRDVPAFVVEDTDNLEAVRTAVGRASAAGAQR
jgi:PAS domain S-box-containing protein